VLMNAFSHNPVVAAVPSAQADRNESFAIFHIGCGNGGSGGLPPCTSCKGGITGSCKGHAETVSCSATTTNVLRAGSLNGPWSASNVPIKKMGMPPLMGKFGVDNPGERTRWNVDWRLN
jgi:hypothetical protein